METQEQIWVVTIQTENGSTQVEFINQYFSV